MPVRTEQSVNMTDYTPLYSIPLKLSLYKIEPVKNYFLNYSTTFAFKHEWHFCTCIILRFKNNKNNQCTVYYILFIYNKIHSTII